MLVSIVVPAYNEERYLPMCLAALRQLEHPGFDYEVIVVDDGSTDRTRQTAAAWGARVLGGPHGGVAAARQIGFEAARGEIIASTDADTAPAADWLVGLVHALRGGPRIVGAYGPIRLFDGSPFERWASQYLGGAYLALNAAIRRPTFSGANFAVWRHAFQATGGFDTDWASAEDVNLSLKLRRIGRVVFDWRIVVYTSSRRAREGYWAVLVHTLSNYMRVTWLGKPPLPFSDIR